ncbi:MAG: DUF4918 family protein [Chitinophagaceae bacterium]|nr:DUF4918 family protein [Chitinophagaceae bacterium]
MKTFANRMISFNDQLHFPGKLPRGVKVMNPFTDNTAKKISSAFYKKFYNDNNPRFLILGINPGRFGAGLTGVPFTDTKRLEGVCGIPFPGTKTHEPSSAFVYEVVDAMGGPERFYGNFFIQSVCPLGFTIRNAKGRDVNYNYYDDKKLTKSVMSFVLDNIRKQFELGIYEDIIFCFGTGKNLRFINQLNEKHHFFKEIIPLEHPRFIMQYKSKSKQLYIDKYLNAFNDVMKRKDLI